MTRAEQQRAAEQFAALMKRVRAVSAGASRQAIREVDAALAEAATRFAKVAAGTGTMTTADATRLLGTLTKSLKAVETTWVAATKKAQTTIFTAIVNQHKAVNFSVAKVTSLDATGVALRLDTVPAATRQLMAAARKGQTIDSIIKGHVGDAEDSIATFVKGATGKMPSAQAVAGIRRLLGGELPVDLGGMSKTDARVGASLPWKTERVITTESFEGYRQGNAQATTHAVVEMVAKWTTAKDHIVCPECIALSKADVGFGPGWYPPDRWPKAPHPNCRCYQGEIRVLGPAPDAVLAADPNVANPGQYAKRKALIERRRLAGLDAKGNPLPGVTPVTPPAPVVVLPPVVLPAPVAEPLPFIAPPVQQSTFAVPQVNIPIKVVKATGADKAVSDAAVAAVKQGLDELPATLKFKLNNAGLKVQVGRSGGNVNGLYKTAQREVFIKAVPRAEGGLKSTFIHEMGHATDFLVANNNEPGDFAWTWSTSRKGRTAFIQVNADLNRGSLHDAVTRLVQANAPANEIKRFRYLEYLKRCGYTRAQSSFEMEITADSFAALHGTTKIRGMWTPEEFRAMFPEIVSAFKDQLKTKGITLG